jgi:hypothetical protein
MPYGKIPPPDVHSCPVENSSGHSLPDAVPHLNLAVAEMLPGHYFDAMSP